MAEGQATSSPATKIGIGLAILTVIVSIVNGIPAFIALKGQESYVVYETNSSQMLYPSTSDRQAIRKLLIENNIPDAYGTILLSNRGDISAKEVVLTITVPGVIVAERTDPDPSSKPAWVTVAKEYDPDKDKSRIKYILKDVGIIRNFKIDVSYISEPFGDINWDVFYDGKPSVRVNSINTVPDNARSISFKPTLIILGIGLVLSLIVFLLVRLQLSRETLGLATAIASNPGWREYKNGLLFELAKHNGVSLLSVADGNFRAREPRNFWDAIIIVNGIKVALDVHTQAQKWKGIWGTSSDQLEYALRIIAMAQNGSEDISVVAIVHDQDCWSQENGIQVAKILTNMSNSQTGLKLLFLFGTVETVSKVLVDNVSNINENKTLSDKKPLPIPNEHA